MRVGLISCCSSKLDRPSPAKELYRSPLFQASRDWITKPGRVKKWAILSALHGLVMPEDKIEPYNVCLADLSVDDRRKWASKTEKQIINTFRIDSIFLVIAGEHYKKALSRMPYVEDVIGGWTHERKDRGIRHPMSIGILIKLLRSGKCFGA